MALKFRKRITVFPGFTLNLSKSGMSATIGMKGLSLNIGKKETYLNTGIPCTGLYDRVKLSGKQTRDTDSAMQDDSKSLSTIPDDAIEIKSYELLTSEGLFGLKEAIINAQIVKKELKKEKDKLASEKDLSFFWLILSYLWIVGFFTKHFQNQYNTLKEAHRLAEETYQNFKL